MLQYLTPCWGHSGHYLQPMFLFTFWVHYSFKALFNQSVLVDLDDWNSIFFFFATTVVSPSIPTALINRVLVWLPGVFIIHGVFTRLLKRQGALVSFHPGVCGWWHGGADFSIMDEEIIWQASNCGKTRWDCGHTGSCVGCAACSLD